MADTLLSRTTAVIPLSGRGTFYAHCLSGHTVVAVVVGAVVTRHSRLGQEQQRRTANKRGQLIESRQHTPGLTGKNKR
jgi:hypothetical protein